MCVSLSLTDKTGVDENLDEFRGKIKQDHIHKPHNLLTSNTIYYFLIMEIHNDGSSSTGHFHIFLFIQCEKDNDHYQNGHYLLF